MLALQFFATLLLAAVAVQLVRRVFVRRDLAFAVRFGQTVAIPGAGVIAFLVQPTDFPLAIWFAVAGVALAFISVAIRIVAGAREERRSPDFIWSSDDLAGGRLTALAVRAFEVAGLTTLIGGLEPAFALANAAVNAAWIVLWLPPRLRESRAEHSIEIAAPRSAVWSAMSDLSSDVWTRYPAVELDIAPPGKLAPGTTIRAVSRVPLTQRWHGRDEILIRSESRVTALVEGTSFTVVANDNRSGTERSIIGAGHGSVVRMTSWFRSTVTDGIVGRALVFRQNMAAYDEIAQGMLVRLKEKVEGAP